ncbi:MAG: M48 family metallopeptidase [Synechococcales cyanobacterium CRU_2_2]|nr:M48 family metallopeptidase [Synechococcales cyanobacterium CRU_2_2]
MDYIPTEFDDDINVTPVHPLINLGYLLGTVFVFGLVVFGSLGAIGAHLAAHMGPQTEANIGKALVGDFLEDKAAPADLGAAEDTRPEYLKKLILSFYATGSKPRLPLQVYIVEDALPNAFILPGGHIFVTSTLLEQAESENELAFVLAHELGHFEARDNLKGLGRSLVFITLASLLDFGGSSSGVINSTINLSSMSYSRTQEAQADAFALRAVVQKYGHSGNSLDFFRRLEQQKDLPVPEIELLSSHPLTENRIESLEKFARDRGMKTTGPATALPERLECPSFKPCPN